MAMLTKPRATVRRDASGVAGQTVKSGVTTFEVRRDRDELGGYPIKGGVTIYRGALVCIDTHGWAMPGQPGTGLVTVGYALDGGTARYNGELSVNTRRGTILVENSTGADRITGADVGARCYVVDDQTVAKTNGGGQRPVAGFIRDVDAKGVWVEL